MSSHFAAIGFPIREIREYRGLMQEAAERGRRFPLPGGGALVQWEIGDGPEIWTILDSDGVPIEATPFFATGAVLRVGLTEAGEDTEEPSAGWIEGWVEPVDPEEPITGAFPARIDLVNFALVRERLRTGDVVRVEVCALAHETQLYPDPAAYDIVRENEYRPPMRSFISAGHFAADLLAADPDEHEPEAMALISGVLSDAELRTSPHTRAAYWRTTVETDEVSIPVLADRETLAGEPRAGNVMSASCWILGRAMFPE